MKQRLLVGVAVWALALSAPARAQEADWLWRVQPGDTLIDLSAAWLEPPHGWRELQKLNRVADPLRLMPGTRLRLPIAWLKREAAVAELQFVKGQVLRKRPGEGDTPLAVGAQVRSGDTLTTGEQSSASLRLADGSRLLLPPGTELTLEKLLVLGRAALPASTLRLTRGGADNQVNPNAQHTPLYELKAPRVNLGVRGTEFRVQVGEDGATRVEVQLGAVRAEGDATDLAAGQGLVARESGRERAALLPAPDLGSLPRRVERLPLQLRWAASPAQAVAWRAQVFARGQPDALLLDARVSEPQATWAKTFELPDGDYTLRLRAIDRLGLEGAAAEADFSLQARPEPPFIQAPAAAATLYGESVEWAWSRNTAAPAVRLQVARDEAFSDLVLQPTPVEASSYRAPLPPGVYHWRVASVAGERAGPFGDPQRFELKPPPPAPPPAEPQVEGDRLALRWRSDTGVVRYEAEWADNEAFQAAQKLETDKPELVLARPAPGRYVLRVRGFNAAGVAGPWGQPQLIEIPRDWKAWLWLAPLLLLLH